MASIFRLIGRLWRGLDVVRRALHLVLLLVIFAIVWAAFHPPSPVLPSKTALTVRPEGVLVEQLSGDAVDRAVGEASGRTNPETLVKELTDSIRAAAKDPRVPVLVLDTSELAGGGLSKLESVAGAIREFRATGKKVLAYGGAVSQGGYYLLAQADEVWLEPSGALDIDGYATYRHYLHDVLERLGVTVNVFKVGTYKSAVEEFTLTQMSAADREQTEAYLKPLWAAYAAGIGRARNLAPDFLTGYVDRTVANLEAANGDSALVAEQAGLVTGRKTRVEFEARVAEFVGVDSDTHSYQSVDTAQYAAVALHGDAEGGTRASARVAVIPAVGMIKDGEQPPGTVGGDSYAELLRDARFDDTVKAVVLRVDSPGGSVAASERIRQEVEAIKAAGKPVVASFGSVAASGGYYIAMDADEIYAEPTTITGSIGVFVIVPTFERALGKIGVGTDGVATSPFAGAMNLGHELGPEVKQALQKGVEFTYASFVGHVAKARGKPAEAIDAIAQGRVWIAPDALERGLVDHIGGLKEAIQAAAKRAKLAEGQYGVTTREKRLTWSEALVRSLRTSTARLAVRAGLVKPVDPATARVLGTLESTLGYLGSFNDPRGLYVYCDCERR